jgi:hypothetical protein
MEVQVQVQVQFTPQGATRLAPHVMYGFLKFFFTLFFCLFFFFFVYSMLNACMLANTSLLVLRSSGFERGRLYTQFSTLSTIEKNSFYASMLCVCIMGIQPSKNIRDRSKTHQMASFSASPFFFLSQNSFRPDVSQKYRPDVSTKTKHLPPDQPVHSHPSEERGDVVG